MLRYKTAHQQRVEVFLQGIDRHVPDRPELPARAVLCMQGNLILEEALETLAAAGLVVKLDLLADEPKFTVLTDYTITPDLVAIADGIADLSVVTTGLASLCGIADDNILAEVDANNLLKITNGHRDPVSGKFIKPKDHPKPKIEECLKQQGWVDNPISKEK